jgi:hypothetical protein
MRSQQHHPPGSALLSLLQMHAVKKQLPSDKCAYIILSQVDSHWTENIQAISAIFYFDWDMLLENPKRLKNIFRLEALTNCTNCYH